MTQLIDIDGIGAVSAGKLKTAGVTSVEELLEQGGTPEGRKMLAEKSGLSPKRLLRWVNHADLYRLKGVARQYAELLEASGVDTVVELSHRNAGNLVKQLDAANKKKNLVDLVPSLAQVERWIAEAKTLPRKVTY